LNVTNAINIDQGGEIDVAASGASLTGASLTNFGTLTLNNGGTLTVSGAFTNESRANTHLYNSGFAGTMNVGTLVNSGFVEIDSGQTLNLTNQPGGITDIVAGSTLNQYGTFNVTNGLGGAVTAAALANLGSIEGYLTLGSASQALTISPGSGTLTIANTGQLNVTNAQQLTVSGNVDNSGVYSQGQGANGAGTVTVTGTFTNESHANTHLYNSGFAGTMNVGTLVNSGFLTIDLQQTLAVTNAYTQMGTSASTVVGGMLTASTFNLGGGMLTGTGTVTGNVTNSGGTVEGIDPLHITGNYSQGPGGTLFAAVNDDTHYDLLDVTGEAFLKGTLDISLNPAFLPSNGEKFIILDAAGGLNGTEFTSYIGTSFGTNGTWDVLYGADSVTLEATYSSNSSVPEPSSLALLGIGLLVLAWIVRRQGTSGMTGAIYKDRRPFSAI
jgi:hypothetical protein